MEKQFKSYSLKTAQRQAFLQIFNMHAKNGKITRKDLKQIFQRINFVISKQHFSQVCEKSFNVRQQITFQQFMETFIVNQSQFNMIDIKNSFRLIAGQQDTYIPLDKLYQLFRKQDYDKQRVNSLIQVLSVYIDEKKRFNYKLFLSHLN